MIRIGTIGTGAITTTLAAAVAETEGVRIAAVHSRDRARAEQLAAEFGADAAFDDVDALLSAETVDAVYVASPNALHHAQALAAIRAGKHVLVEKPATLHADEWMTLVGAARDAGVLVLEAMRTEHDPGLAEVRRLLPELGRLRRATFRYESRSARYDRVLAGERVNIFDPAMGGGALRDLGVYGLHAMVSLFGAPSAVFGEAVEIVSGAEGAGIVVARYDGLVVDVAYSKISGSSSGSEIQGEDGTLAIDHIASPRRLVLTTRSESREIHVAGAQHSLVGEVARFVHLVRTGEPADLHHARTFETLRILDSVAG